MTEKDKIKRQPLSVSITELMDLADELNKQRLEQKSELGIDYGKDKRWQVNIIQKTKFDNWELENDNK